MLFVCRGPVPPGILAWMELRLAPLQTARLRLEPLTAEMARAWRSRPGTRPAGFTYAGLDEGEALYQRP